MDWSYQDTAGNQYRLKAIATNRLTGEKEAVYIDCQTQEIMVESLSSFEQWVDLVDAPMKETRLTVQEKIKLYRPRFNGRSDIYAKRYYNKKAQRDVYSPATGFIDGRPNRDDLLPLTDEVVKEHLQGKIFIGIYPLLRDDTCNFLVIDIDKHNWKEITKSLSKVCRQFKIPIAVERSQSGNGAHLWVFFAHKMAAELARHFGQAILKRAMAINTSISFSAFDRLFPSQNHLTQKGFGNLIAAPLQYQRMKLGNSLFIDEDFKPYKNQWEFLAQIKLMDERRVKEVIGKLEEGNTFRLFQQLDTYEPDLLQDDLLTIKTGIKIIRSDQLYIDMADLNSRQINALRWAATFDNPDFYKKQKQRLSTWDTPRYVSLASHQGKYLVLPRGVEWFLAARLPQPNFIDKTESGSSLHIQFTGELRSEQLTAQEALLKQRMGVLAARTGFGKTVIAASMIAEKAVSTLVIVNNRELANQWQKQLLHFLEITDEPWVELTKTGRKKKKSIIGTYFSGHKSVSRLVDVATVQTLSRMKNLPEFLQHYGMVIIDEVHHLAAVTFDDVIKQSPARYVYGLSATPYRRDGWDPIIFMRAGKIAYRTAKTDEHQLLTTTRTVVLRPTGLGELNGGVMSQNSMQDNYEAMIKDQDRNRLIVNDILENFKQNKHQLVLTQRLEQIDVLKIALARWSEITVFELSGHQKNKENQRNIDEIKRCQSPYVILATGSFVGEGFDVHSIDTLLLAMPVSWKGSVEQYLGRLNRDLENKTDLVVYDYVDLFVPMLEKMYQKRQKTYRELQYQIQSGETQSVVQIRSGKLGLGKLQADMKNSKTGVVIGVTTDHPAIVEFVKRLKGPKVTVVCSPKVISAYQALTDVEVVESPQVLNALIIDEKSVWIDYQQLLFSAQENSALEFGSSQLAERFLNVFLNEKPKLF